MAYRLACDHSEEIAAIASFAGETFKNPGDCHARNPVSILQIHAVDDDTIHFAGDAEGYPKLSAYPSTQETLNQWISIDRCPEKARSGDPLKFTVFIPGASDAETQYWDACAGNSSIAFWKIKAYNGYFHEPHTPFLSEQFTDGVLAFLLKHSLYTNGKR